MVGGQVWVGTRPLSHVLAALGRREHYAGAWHALRTYRSPIRQLTRYVTGTGSYPADVALRTPTGRLTLRCWTRHDLLTVHEVFCRHDYALDGGAVTVLDVGANIGVSAAYFLSRHRDNRVIAYEPVPQNLQRLRHNLAPFGDRAVIVPVAVGTEAATASFLTERTGRYGRLEVAATRGAPFAYNDVGRIEVEVRDLRQVLADHPEADVVKLDIEGLEPALLNVLAGEPSADRLRLVMAEYAPGANPLAASHELQQGPSIARFERRTGVAALV